MNLTNEEIAKVFAMYLHSQVMYQDRIGNIVTLYLSCGDRQKQLWVLDLEDENFKENELGCSASILTTKLLLTPISCITDEDAIIVAEIIGYEETKTFPKFILIEKGKSYLQNYALRDANFEITIQIFQFLISRNYAVPLWFGINHWANGKTAIELGIAIEKEGAYA